MNNNSNQQSRVINPRDINFHNGPNNASPTKKASHYTGNMNQNTSGKNNEVERINVTIPNPLLMPNASVQIQFQQEMVRNVL